MPLLYEFFIHLTSTCGLIPLIANSFVYYIIRFKQINTRIRIYFRIRIISLQSINRLFNQHNQLSLLIYQLNLILNRTMACLFITLAFELDLSFYLLIYNKSIYYKLFFLCILLYTLILIFTLYFLMIKLTNSAHQSYNLIYSIIQRQTISYRTRYKVRNIFNL